MRSNGMMSYRPKALEVRRGEQIKFVITNAGLLSHEFILANTVDNLTRRCVSPSQHTYAHAHAREIIGEFDAWRTSS